MTYEHRCWAKEFYEQQSKSAATIDILVTCPVCEAYQRGAEDARKAIDVMLMKDFDKLDRSGDTHEGFAAAIVERCRGKIQRRDDGGP